jgi:cyclophilin family peptidyl-prolyl cis-trans isomerase
MPATVYDAASVCVLQVVDGFDVVQQIENQRTGAMDRPVNQCRVADCGEL